MSTPSTTLSVFSDGNSRWTHETAESLIVLDDLPKDAREVSVRPSRELSSNVVFKVTRPSPEMSFVAPGAKVMVTKNGISKTGTLKWGRSLSSGSLVLVQTADGGAMVTNPDVVEFARLSDAATLQIVSPPSGLSGATVSCTTLQVQAKVAHLITLDDDNKASSVMTTLSLETGQRMKVDAVTYTEQARVRRAMAEERSFRVAAVPYASEVAAAPDRYADQSAPVSMTVTIHAKKPGSQLTLEPNQSTAVAKSTELKTIAKLIAYGSLWLSELASIDPSKSSLSAVLTSDGMVPMSQTAQRQSLLTGSLRVVSAALPSVSYQTQIDAWSPVSNDFLPLDGTAPMQLESWREDNTTLQSEREHTISYNHVVKLNPTTPLHTKIIVEILSQRTIISATVAKTAGVALTKARPPEIPLRMNNVDAYYLAVDPTASLRSMVIAVVLKM